MSLATSRPCTCRSRDRTRPRPNARSGAEGRRPAGRPSAMRRASTSGRGSASARTPIAATASVSCSSDAAWRGPGRRVQGALRPRTICRRSLRSHSPRCPRDPAPTSSCTAAARAPSGSWRPPSEAGQPVPYPCLYVYIAWCPDAEGSPGPFPTWLSAIPHECCLEWTKSPGERLCPKGGSRMRSGGSELCWVRFQEPRAPLPWPWPRTGLQKVKYKRNSGSLADLLPVQKPPAPPLVTLQKSPEVGGCSPGS